MVLLHHEGYPPPTVLTTIVLCPIRPRRHNRGIQRGVQRRCLGRHNRGLRREYHQGSRRQEDLWWPLSIELEEVPWPHRFNAAIVPPYEGESDPREFFLKYEAVVVKRRGFSNQGKGLRCGNEGSSSALVCQSTKGPHILWSQLKLKLLTSFCGGKPEEITSSEFHNCKNAEGNTL